MAVEHMFGMHVFGELDGGLETKRSKSTENHLECHWIEFVVVVFTVSKPTTSFALAMQHVADLDGVFVVLVVAERIKTSDSFLTTSFEDVAGATTA